MLLKGNIWKYGDDVNTDYIIPGRYMELTDPEEMAEKVFEEHDPSFRAGVKQGDIVVGRTNFGCGSSREHAPIALLGNGVSIVLAESFARIFYRNAINIGLPALECPGIHDAVEKGDVLEVDVTGGYVRNLSNGKELRFKPLPPFMVEVLNAGGLAPYLNKTEEW
ncbi:MAG: 3-isopropylmalate dehydratase small subunit [Candidatus Bathyarchaeota archaeon]|nr:3-isopropylmalate dehydratase small subunit [Candidatus Bathyarchaeota archaeon]